MKKSILILVAVSALIISCGGKSDKEKELELRERELALKEMELGINPSKQYLAPIEEELTESELKEKLFKSECSKPKDFLAITCTASPNYKNLLSMKVTGLELSGKIKNSATIATFKNIKAIAKFKSKTGATIFTKTFDIYEFVEPNRNVLYKTEVEITNQQFEDFSNFNIDIIEAECN